MLQDKKFLGVNCDSDDAKNCETFKQYLRWKKKIQVHMQGYFSQWGRQYVLLHTLLAVSNLDKKGQMLSTST